MSDPNNATAIATIAANHVNAEFAGITPNTGATVTPPGNATTWSRKSAQSALQVGAITSAQYFQVMRWLDMSEQTANAAALDPLHGT